MKYITIIVLMALTIGSIFLANEITKDYGNNVIERTNLEGK